MKINDSKSFPFVRIKVEIYLAKNHEISERSLSIIQANSDNDWDKGMGIKKVWPYIILLNHLYWMLWGQTLSANKSKTYFLKNSTVKKCLVTTN